MKIARLKGGYGQFCPVAKASAIFATRWTPLVLRELLFGSRTFNDIHRGVPLMSRALLAERLRQLERNGIVEKRTRAGDSGHEYLLTPAGEATREIVHALGHWGHAYTSDRISVDDLDPALMLWTMRQRTNTEALPGHRVVIRFEFSGVPKSRTRFRIMWLILDRSGIDVCAKDPGFRVDITVQGNIKVFVELFLGQKTWNAVLGRAVSIEGDVRMARRIPGWIELDKVPRPQPSSVAPAA
jgi:DNA-binding HxlR family transcriptional regulator